MHPHLLRRRPEVLQPSGRVDRGCVVEERLIRVKVGKSVGPLRPAEHVLVPAEHAVSYLLAELQHPTQFTLHARLERPHRLRVRCGVLHERRLQPQHVEQGRQSHRRHCARPLYVLKGGEGIYRCARRLLDVPRVELQSRCGDGDLTGVGERDEHHGNPLFLKPEPDVALYGAPVQ